MIHVLKQSSSSDVLLRGVFLQGEEEVSMFASEKEATEEVQKFVFGSFLRMDPGQPHAGGVFQYRGQRFRWQAVMHPISPSVCFHLRRHNFDQLRFSDFASDLDYVSSIEAAIKQNHNILVCGATGSGKTSLLFLILQKYCALERVVLLENQRELPDGNLGWIPLVRAAATDIGAEVDLGALVQVTQRLHPDRVVFGEILGYEVSLYQQVQRMGFKGVYATFHAQNSYDLAYRFGELERTLVIFVDRNHRVCSVLSTCTTICSLPRATE